ncbi:MAG: fumarate hydratase C-terminal domain-containing protein [Vicinamibacterales bacterium]
MSDDYPRLQLPLTPERARALTLGDVYLLDGEMTVTVGLPTVKRLVAFAEANQAPPVDIRGGTFMHMGICSRPGPDGDRLEPLYINPTTSTRFDALMPTVIRHFGLTAVGGKGGLGRGCVDAMREAGCVYFSVVGGASALLSPGIESIVETGWDDFIMQFRLTRVRLSGFGPVTVAIDAHGNSLYEQLDAAARARVAALLADRGRP